MATLPAKSGKLLINPIDPKLSERDCPVTMETPQSNTETTKTPRQRYPKGQRKAFGVAQVILGLVFISFGIPLILSPASFAAKIGTPWWGGVMFIISGIVSIAADRKMNKHALRTCAVINLLGASAALGAFLLFSIDLRMWVPYLLCNGGTGCEEREIALSESQFSLRIVLLIFAVLELSISIAASTIGWKEVWEVSGESNNELPKDLLNSDHTYESVVLRDTTYTPMSAIKINGNSMVAK